MRSSSSSVFKWPDPESVLSAARRWADHEARTRPGLLKLGYFGSYARGESGVGSDLDWVAVVESSDAPFIGRGAAFDLLDLPVPAEIVVYTRDEWLRLLASGSRFARVMRSEAVWLVDRP